MASKILFSMFYMVKCQILVHPDNEDAIDGKQRQEGMSGYWTRQLILTQACKIKVNIKKSSHTIPVTELAPNYLFDTHNRAT